MQEILSFVLYNIGTIYQSPDILHVCFFFFFYVRILIHVIHIYFTTPLLFACITNIPRVVYLMNI